MPNNDKAKLIELINLYPFALNIHQWNHPWDHQWDLFDRAFTEDVVAVFGPAGTA